MAEPLTININQAATPTPLQYAIPDSLELQLLSAYARFDGSAAAGEFLPCLTIYSPAGLIIARVFPGDTLGVGEAADVTFVAGVEVSGQAVEWSTYEFVAAASNNAASIKATSATLGGYYVYNASAATRFVKFYNVSGTPSPASDTPKWVVGLTAGAAANISFGDGIAFNTGLGIAAVAGISNTDNTAISANDLVASIAYR